MIYFHKILPLLTAPMCVVLFLLVIGLVMKRSAFSISGLTILLIFSNPLFAEWAIRQAEKPFVPINIDSLQKSDFVVVLSGDAARFDTALRILEKDKAAKMIVTAGKTPWEKKQLSDGHQYMNVAKQIGMKSDKKTKNYESKSLLYWTKDFSLWNFIFSCSTLNLICSLIFFIHYW